MTAIGLAAFLSLAGCYEHVVRTDGSSFRAVDTYEPNLKKDEHIPIIDDVVNLAYPKN